MSRQLEGARRTLFLVPTDMRETNALEQGAHLLRHDGADDIDNASLHLFARRIVALPRSPRCLVNERPDLLGEQARNRNSLTFGAKESRLPMLLPKLP